MDDWVLRIPWSATMPSKAEILLTQEWLVTNGLGGYASGTVAGVASRRYHSLLIAALPSPLGRMVMLNHLSEMLRLPDGGVIYLRGEELASGSLKLPGAEYLTEFRLECGLPVWLYQANGHVIEKRVFLPHRQNTVYVNYRLAQGEGTVRLKLRPSVHFRHHEAPVSEKHAGPYTFTCLEDRYELSVPAALPPLKMYL